MELLFSILRLAAPLIYASFGGLFSERSGVINIALEGFMLVGAFVGALVALKTGSPWLGFAAAGAAGFAFALLYAFAVISGSANQVVAGTAMNLLAMGLIPFFLKLLFGTSAGTPSLESSQVFLWFPLAFAFLLVPLVWIFFRTPLGLWVSFAGENPAALAAAGIKVQLVRYASVCASGFLAALGGATLSLCLASGYSRNMVAGRGFMALAALILGKWKPLPALGACLFFGVLEALQIRMQSWELPIPAEFVLMIPYLCTMLVLAGFVGRARAPKALGL